MGVESAQLFARFGSLVWIVDEGARLLSSEPPESSAVVTAALREEGIDVRTGVRVLAIRRTSRGTAVEVSDGSHLEPTAILVAAGRAPRDLRPILTGVEATLDDDGRARPDTSLRISDSIFVAGDVAGGPQFTHVADYEGRLAARAALGERVEVDLRGVPRVTYTDPEVASVGMTVADARAAGLDPIEIRLALDETSKGIVTEATGTIALVAEAADGSILGMSCVARGGAEVANLGSIAIRSGLRAGELAELPLAFPTWGRECALLARAAVERIERNESAAQGRLSARSS